MELKQQQWSKDKYQEYVKYLESLQDISYKEFHSKLTTTKYEIIGIRVPIQRKIAKEICKGDVFSFLKECKENYYEEVLIKGFVIAHIKEKEAFLSYFSSYLPLIDNWAICDGFCNCLELVKEHPEELFTYFLSLLQAKEVFTIRVGIVVLLTFYIQKEYLEDIFKAIDQIQVDSYYVNMAIAWLLCSCFIKYREKTLLYLEKSHINTFTFNKTISKIRDSYCVSLEEKEFVQSLRRKEEKHEKK